MVVDGSSGGPVADISIVIAAPDGRIAGAGRTDADGKFAVTLSKGGQYLLRALRMGYKPTEMALVIEDTSTVRVEFELSSSLAAATPMLAPVIVRGRRVDLPARLLEAYERAKRNHAAIFSRDDVALTNNFTFALGTVPGVHINARGVILFRTCPKVQVYINGTRFWATNDSPASVLKLVAPADVELMEVYTHVSRLPVEYVDDACAVIAVWTK